MKKQQNTEPEAIILPQEPNDPNQPPAYRSDGHPQTTPGYPQQPTGGYPMQQTKGNRHVPSYPIGQVNMQQPGPSGRNNTTQVVMTVSNENIFGVPEGEMRGRREGGRREEEMRETKGMERN